MRTILLLTFLLPACESGTSVVVDLEVADSVAAATSAAAPSVLVVDVGDESRRAAAALCGEPYRPERPFTVDNGFGCLRVPEGTELSLRAWAEPMPASWNADALCAAEPGFGGLSLDAAIVGEPVDGGVVGDELAAEPVAAWPIGEGTASWRRDFSPCGGVARGSVRVE